MIRSLLLCVPLLLLGCERSPYYKEFEREFDDEVMFLLRTTWREDHLYYKLTGWIMGKDLERKLSAQLERMLDAEVEIDLYDKKHFRLIRFRVPYSVDLGKDDHSMQIQFQGRAPIDLDTYLAATDWRLSVMTGHVRLEDVAPARKSK